jgi:SNF2 family DNA or RNA helicase
MELIYNSTKTLCDDLKQTITPNSKLSIAAACFSIYAFKALKEQLESIEELRFIFTSPTFVQDKTPKSCREFYIPRLERERTLYGSDFEIKLRNELAQKAIAKECADWIRKKVTFKSQTNNTSILGSIDTGKYCYYPIQRFTTVELGCEPEVQSNTTGQNPIIKLTEADESAQILANFNQLWNNNDALQDVTNMVISCITCAYKENPPEFIYFYILYNIFREFLDDISEDVLPNEATGFKDSKIWNMLYNFQKDAALAIINKLEKYNGCILADSVGLGKTYTALSVIKYYENKNKSVLVLCPKKLSENWNTYKGNYVNNPIAQDRLRFDVLFHTDLSRKKGKSNGIELSRLNWSNYDLIVIDESHNFRNGYGSHINTQTNRYKRLMSEVLQKGVKTKVLMLSATPVNTDLSDLKNQLALAYEDDPSNIDDQLNTKKSIDDIFKNAQKALNQWLSLDIEKRTTQALLQKLSFDFFELLDSVTIARSRRHIEKYYNMEDIGNFPKREDPISLRPGISDLGEAVSYKDINDKLLALNLAIYTPSSFIQESKKEKYKQLTHNKGTSLTQIGREEGIRRLMWINLLKRLESSVHSFRLTLSRILEELHKLINIIEEYEHNKGSHQTVTEHLHVEDFDSDELESDLFSVGNKVSIKLEDMDHVSWKNAMADDVKILRELLDLIKGITPEHDTKLQALFDQIRHKQENPINPGNRKIIIFSAFADTAEYLYEHVSKFAKETFGLDSALVTGSVEGKSTIPDLDKDLNSVLTCFSPISKEKHLLMPHFAGSIDILIATDCISEGQNLQDCDYLINYDIHWNPVRIIQRFGRIDRIGSKNNSIQLVNFWPDINLDEYINLKRRVESRMRLSVMTSTGDEDPINIEEKGDLEYRQAQLQMLQKKVIDIEDMSSGISILDLGLNEFRLDLIDYMKHHDYLDSTPNGIHAVVSASQNCPRGVIFILKNLNTNFNLDARNRIHPFYMVYVAADGSIKCDYLNPKRLLDDVRLLCQDKSQPDIELCSQFNARTSDGKNMAEVSALLGKAISSIIKAKDNADSDSLFEAGGTSALINTVKGLDDFELISFLVIE